MGWNQTFNLVSRGQTNNLDDHILDSLSILPHIGDNLIDLGSGAGFPGIPIAIVSANKRVFLVEPSQKRASFLLHVCSGLELKNTKILNKRAEELSPQDFPQPYEILTRAFGTTKKTIKATKRLMEAPLAKLTMMKTAPFQDHETLTDQFEITRITNTRSKGKNKQHILVTIEKTNKCTR